MGCKGSKSVQVEDIPQPEVQPPTPPPAPRSPSPPPEPEPEIHDEEKSEPVKPPAHPRKKRVKRDFGIKFYDSSKGHNGTAKYTYEIKGRTSRVYKAEPADLKTVKKHCRKKKRENKGDVEDLRLIQEVHAQNSIVSELEQRDQELESVILDDDRPECDCDCCLEEQEEKRRNSHVSFDLASEKGTGVSPGRGKPHVNGKAPCNGDPHSEDSRTGHSHSGHASTGHPPNGYPLTGHPPTGHPNSDHKRVPPGSHGNKRITSSGHISRTNGAVRRSRESFASNRSVRSTDSVCSEKSTDRIFLKLDTAPGDFDYHQYRIHVIKDRQDSAGTPSPPAKPKRPKSKLMERYGIKSPYSYGKPVVRTFRPRTSSASGPGHSQERSPAPVRRHRPVTAAFTVHHPDHPGTPAPPGSPDLEHMRAQYMDQDSVSNGSVL